MAAEDTAATVAGAKAAGNRSDAACAASQTPRVACPGKGQAEPDLRAPDQMITSRVASWPDLRCAG
jgi:hypothetical protein